MRYTNFQRLPLPVYNAIVNDDYDAGISDYTPSSLNRPAYQNKLLKENNNKIEVDVSSRLWALMGKAMHSILEQSKDEDSLREVRVYRQIDKWLIGMQMDRLWLQDSVLQDYKFTSAWAFIKNEPKPEWESQLNIGAYILKDCFYLDGETRAPVKVDVKKLEIIGLLRDYSEKLKLTNPDYPKHQITTMNIPMWKDDMAKSYITQRALEQEKYMSTPLDQLEPCSKEERWATDDKWALMKKGNKKASKLFDNEEDAENAKSDVKHFVEYRPAEAKRCVKQYCDVYDVCPFKGGKE